MVVVICIGILLVGIFVWRRLAGVRSGGLFEESDSAPADSEAELLVLCLGDRAQMERLIALETKKSPGMPRTRAIARAVRAMRRDRR